MPVGRFPAFRALQALNAFGLIYLAACESLSERLTTHPCGGSPRCSGSDASFTCTDHPNCTQLYLFGEALSGTLPSQVAMLTSVVDLRLYDNALSGQIPTQLAALTPLQIL